MKRLDVERLADEELAQRAAPPMVGVSLQGACAGRRRCPSVEGVAKIDTGASNTFIAPSAVKRLKLKRVGRGTVRGLGGGGRELDRYAVHLTIDGVHEVPLVVRGAYSYPDLDRRGDTALIGRGALAGGDDPTAGVQVTYDGPSGRVAVQSAKRKRRKVGK